MNREKRVALIVVGCCAKIIQWAESASIAVIYFPAANVKKIRMAAAVVAALVEVVLEEGIVLNEVFCYKTSF
jgi:hypothetical protein